MVILDAVATIRLDKFFCKRKIDREPLRHAENFIAPLPLRTQVNRLIKYRQKSKFSETNGEYSILFTTIPFLEFRAYSLSVINPAGSHQRGSTNLKL